MKIGRGPSFALGALFLDAIPGRLGTFDYTVILPPFLFQFLYGPIKSV